MTVIAVDLNQSAVECTQARESYAFGLDSLQDMTSNDSPAKTNPSHNVITNPAAEMAASPATSHTVLVISRDTAIIR